jgi:hypothetical protein
MGEFLIRAKELRAAFIVAVKTFVELTGLGLIRSSSFWLDF